MTAVVELRKFSLYCSIGNQLQRVSVLVGSWPVHLNILSFLVIVFSSLWMISPSPHYVVWCSQILCGYHRIWRGEREIINKEENTITRKLTECIQDNRSSGVTALRTAPWLPLLQYEGNHLAKVQWQSYIAALLWSSGYQAGLQF